MTTSGTIDGQITVLDVLTFAAQDLGVLGSGEALTADEQRDMQARLQWMLKTWQSRGVNLWRKVTGEITIPANQAAGVLSFNVIDIYAARSVSAGQELSMQRWEDGQYNNIPNKLSQGRPMAFYIDKQREAVSIYVWPVPTVDTVLKIDYARVIENVTDVNETLDIPQQWAETVWTNLAVRCATLFGATRLDPAAVQMVTERALGLEQSLLDQDRPSSVYMGSQWQTN